MDAAGLAKHIARGEQSAFEVVEETIERIERLNPHLNALTSKRYEKALKESKTRDFSGLPFGGVPILLKDLGQEQVGEPSTSGSRLFLSYRASISDNYVKAIEALGFIVIGRTNTPEFGFKNISDSRVHGNVNLPIDISRNAGGSSGGAAAAVSSGMVTIAGASDGGGSIRIPASFNNLIGLKPSRGRIPVGPESFRGWQGLSVHFALTKTVRDTKALLYGLQSCQMESPFVLPTLSWESLQLPLGRSLTIAVQYQSPVGNTISDDAILAVNHACDILRDLGHQIVVLDQFPIDGWEAIKGYYVMNSVETALMFETIESSLGKSLTSDDMEVMTWALYRAGKKIPATLYSHIIQSWDKYSHLMTEFHKEYDILLSPATADVAPKHDYINLSSDLKEKLLMMDSYDKFEQQELILEMFRPGLELTPFNQQANQTGQPSISLPLYRGEENLPLGIQLTAEKGREDLLLALAEQIEACGAFY